MFSCLLVFRAGQKLVARRSRLSGSVTGVEYRARFGDLFHRTIISGTDSGSGSLFVMVCIAV